MRRWRRDSQRARISPQQSKVYFSYETEMNKQCAICLHSSSTLVKPCQCNLGYHQTCFLHLIKERITGELKQRQQMDLTTLKCQTCHHRFFLMFRHQSYCSCQIFCAKMSSDCCNNYIIVLSTLLIITIITVALSIMFEVDKNIKTAMGLKYGLISALVIQSLIFVALLTAFLNKYMTNKLFILEKVLDMIDVRSVSSQNSQENKVNENEEIIIPI